MRFSFKKVLNKYVYQKVNKNGLPTPTNTEWFTKT